MAPLMSGIHNRYKLECICSHSFFSSDDNYWAPTLPLIMNHKILSSYIRCIYQSCKSTLRGKTRGKQNYQSPLVSRKKKLYVKNSYMILMFQENRLWSPEVFILWNSPSFLGQTSDDYHFDCISSLVQCSFATSLWQSLVYLSV